MTHTLWLALVAVLLLPACALPPQAILRDPVSGQTVNCTALSEVNVPAASFPIYGSAGRAMGAGMADGITSAFRERDCINRYLAVGFQPAGAVAPPLSNPRQEECPPGWVRDARNVCDKP